MMNVKSVAGLLKQTFQDWLDDDAPRLAAALAYYTLLSLAPLLMLAVSIAGLVFGADAARGQIGNQLSAVVGPEAGKGIEAILAHARSPDTSIWSSVVGGIVLLFGASGVFGELQATLDTIWDVKPRPGRGIRGIVRDRFLSFTMVLGVAFLLLVSMVVSTALSALGAFFSERLPGGAVLWEILNFVISLGIITALFALIFKVVPDIKIGFRDVWVGAFVTALLFTLGKAGLGLYLGRASVASPYGAAGSLIVLIIWVYYASQILFLGAEFTQALAQLKGRRIEPGRNAVALADEAKPADAPQTARPPFVAPAPGHGTR